MTGLRAIVFDAFETLFVNRPDQWVKTLGEICRQQGLPADPESLYGQWRKLEREFRQTRTSLENPERNPPFTTYRAAWEDAFRRVFDGEGLQGDPVAAAELAIRHLAARDPYQDAREALPQLRRGPWSLAVLSNADNAFLEPVLQRHPIVPFDAVLSSESARVYKPHPLAFSQVLQRVEARAEEALLVGDALYDDVHGAREVGLWTVWVNRHGKERDGNLAPPHYEIASLERLPAIVERLAGGRDGHQA